MKFCYIDESGTGGEKIAVSVGIVVDAQRMHLTKSEWAGLLNTLNSIAKQPIKELHTRDLYSGNNEWRGVDGADRAKAITEIIDWLIERKHKITFSAIDTEQYNIVKSISPICTELRTIWRMMAFHLTLTLQRAHNKLEKNKGHTVLIFDRELHEEKHISALIHNPPSWSDSYYSRGARQEQLDQIIDVPYFGDSEQVGLLQVADLVAYVLRRHAELEDKADSERYVGEKLRIAGWTHKVGTSCLSSSSRYPKKNRCTTADAFYQIAPASLRSL